MFDSTIYAILALALGVALAVPAQAGWNAWNAPPTTAAQQPTVAPAPESSGYEAYARARKRYRHLPNATIRTPAHRPGMTGHTLHHPGH